jgi:hypothetical protein
MLKTTCHEHVGERRGKTACISNLDVIDELSAYTPIALPPAKQSPFSTDIRLGDLKANC